MTPFPTWTAESLRRSGGENRVAKKRGPALRFTHISGPPPPTSCTSCRWGGDSALRLSYKLSRTTKCPGRVCHCLACERSTTGYNSVARQAVLKRERPCTSFHHCLACKQRVPGGESVARQAMAHRYSIRLGHFVDLLSSAGAAVFKISARSSASFTEPCCAH